MIATAMIWAVSTVAAFQQAQRLVPGKGLGGAGGPRGKNPRKDGPQSSPHAMHAEGVERVVVLEVRLKARAGQEADDADGHAHQQSGHGRDDTRRPA